MGKIINENKKFPEKLIPIGWKYKKLFEICSIEYGKSPQNIECLDGKFSIFGTGGIIGRTNSFIYDKPSIIIGRKGTLNKPVLIDIPFWTIDTTFYIKIKGQYNIPWLFYYLDYIKLERFNEASGVPSLSRENLYCLKILTPSLSEQKIISNILTTWEKSIRQLEKLISIKKKMKKALMQQLLTGKKRLKGFNDKAEYHALKNYIYEISVRNKNNDINNVLSVTNTKGFINQSEQFDKSVASDDLSNYKIIKKGQFAYNPSRVNVGSIDLLKSFNYGILSPMYIIFETDNKGSVKNFVFLRWLYLKRQIQQRVNITRVVGFVKTKNYFY